jgi:hypothetical protein
MPVYNQTKPYFNAGAAFTAETRETFMNNLLSGECFNWVFKEAVESR